MMIRSASTKPQVGSQINWGHPLAQGLFASWIFNEGLGKVYNDGVNRSPLTITGSNIAWGDRLHGPDVALSSSDPFSYLASGDTSNFDFSHTQPLTMELMFLTTSTTSQDIFGNGNNTGGRGFYIQINNPSTAKLQLYLPTSFTNYLLCYTTSNSISTNTWSHAVITLDGSATVAGCRMYVNGVEFALTNAGDSLNATVTTGVEWVVGRAGNALTGCQSGTRFAWHRIWKKPLSPQEVRQLYAAPFCMYQRRPLFRGVEIAAGAPSQSPLLTLMGVG